MDILDRSYLQDIKQKESKWAGLHWLKEWLRHPQELKQRRSRRENSGLGQVDEDKRAVRENRAVYRPEEMNVEWRGLSASSLCNVAVEIIVTDAFTKSQVESGSQRSFLGNDSTDKGVQEYGGYLQSTCNTGWKSCWESHPTRILSFLLQVQRTLLLSLCTRFPETPVGALYVTLSTTLSS